MIRALLQIGTGVLMAVTGGAIFVYVAVTHRYTLLIIPGFELILVSGYVIVHGLNYFIEREE